MGSARFVRYSCCITIAGSERGGKNWKWWVEPEQSLSCLSWLPAPSLPAALPGRPPAMIAVSPEPRK